MLDEYIKTLNYETLIEDNKKQIIDTFVSFYGEDRREEIEAKINNAVIIPYVPIDQLEKTIDKIKKIKSEEIINKLQEDIAPEISKKIFSKSDYNSSVAFQYFEFSNKVGSTGDKEIPTPLNLLALDPKISAERLLNGEDTEIMDVLGTMEPDIEAYKREYDETIKKIQDKIDLLEFMKQKSEELKSKYLLEFAEKNKEFLGEEYDKMCKEYNNKGTVSRYFYSKLKLLTANDFTFITELDFFSKEAEEEKNEIKIRNIKNERIRYFQAMGIDLGKNYSAYENDERCKQIKPSFEFVEKIQKDREEINKKFQKELYESYPGYISMMGKINEHEVLEDMDVTYNFFSNQMTALYPNAERKDNEIRPIQFVFIETSRDLEPRKLDMAIFHELNHLVEYTPLNANEENLEALCGWDLVSSNYTGDDNYSERKYEMFNEIINDLLAEQVARKFHSDGNSIVSNPSNANYRVCGYRMTEFLVHEFFETYHDQIIKSRNGNIEEITNTVGIENFERLNDLVKEFNDNFDSLSAYSVFGDLREGKITEKTRKLQEIEAKRREIMAAMKEYSSSKKMGI